MKGEQEEVRVEGREMKLGLIDSIARFYDDVGDTENRSKHDVMRENRKEIIA